MRESLDVNAAGKKAVRNRERRMERSVSGQAGRDRVE